MTMIPPNGAIYTNGDPCVLVGTALQDINTALGAMSICRAMMC